MEKCELTIVAAIEDDNELVTVQPIESKKEYKKVMGSMKEAFFGQAYTNKKN